MISHQNLVERRYTPVLEAMRPRVSAVPPRTLSSASIFDGRTEINIDHGGQVYRLKITRQGKLILNK